MAAGEVVVQTDSVHFPTVSSDFIGDIVIEIVQMITINSFTKFSCTLPTDENTLEHETC